MLSESDIAAFINSMDELSKQTIELIRSKEKWIDDANEEVMSLILEIDSKLKTSRDVFSEVEPELGVRLASKFDIGRSLVFLRELSAAQSALVYKMMNPENLSNDDSLLYQAVFMKRLTAIIKAPLVHDIYGSSARVSVVAKFLQKTVSYKIVEDEDEIDAR